MSTYRSRRVIPSAINTPTSIRLLKINNLGASEAERALSEFIDASELNISGKATTDFNTTGLAGNSESPAVLSQLKRIQRSLRGLPPVISEQQSENKRSADEETDRPNKKIKFDESEDNTEEVKEEEDDEEQPKYEEEEEEEEEEEDDDEEEKVQEEEEEKEEEPVEKKKSKKDKSKKDKEDKKDKKKKKKHS